MPNRWPITSGNWSNSAIWSGSLIPTAADVVYANGQIVNIDTDVSFTTIRNDASASAVVVGGFFIPNNGVTITGNVFGNYGVVATNEYVIRCTGSNSSTIIGNISTGGSNYNVGVSMVQGSSLTVTGSVQCSANLSGGGTSNRAIFTTSSGSLRISGSVLCGGNGSSIGTLHINGATTVDIRGEVSSRAGSNAGPVILTQGNANINIVGDVVTGVSTAINVNTGTSILTITGSVYQLPTSANGNQIAVAGTSCNVNISGSIFAGPAAPAISCTITGNTTLRGPIYASVLYPGVSFTTVTTHIVNATGPFYNVNNRNAVFAQNLQLISGSTPTWTFDTETYGEQRTLYTQNWPGNFPSASNVRSGIMFGDTDQFTGTVAIPPTGSVLKGVPVGNATGSASFDTQNVWSALTSSLTVTGSLGARLRNTSTVASDGAAIASKGKL
jgi:hypothetical protein